MPKIAISCYLDNKPKYLLQCRNWLMSMKWLTTPARADIVIHYNPALSTDYVSFFEWMGAKMIPTPGFGSERGNDIFCNKIQQLFSAKIKRYDYVILSDLDIVFLDCPTTLIDAERILGKAAFSPEVEINHLLSILAELDIPVPSTMAKSEFSNIPDIIPTHFNGGLYVIPGRYIDQFAGSWAKWANFWLTKPDILGDALFTSDEHAFGTALLETGLPYGRLPIGANFHTNIGVEKAKRFRPHKLTSLHYHSMINDYGFLATKGIDWIDKHIIAVNKRVKFALDVHLNGFAKVQQFLTPSKIERNDWKRPHLPEKKKHELS